MKETMKKYATFEEWEKKHFKGEDSAKFKSIFEEAHGKKTTKRRSRKRDSDVSRLRPQHEENVHNAQPGRIEDSKEEPSPQKLSGI